MITAIHYTDFLYRPRRPEELDTAQGGGVVFSQGVHQVDIARLLGGGRARSVRAHTGAWDRTRGTEGAYSALLAFESGAFATLVYSGYAHYDSDELSGWISEMGHPKDPAKYWTTRASLQRATQRGSQAQDETALKYTRAYGTGSIDARPAAGHNHFGMIVASCDRADLRPLPNGVMIYADDAAALDPVPPPSVPRVEVIDELADAISGKRPAVHNGEWAMATLEVCLAILESSRAGRLNLPAF